MKKLFTAACMLVAFSLCCNAQIRFFGGTFERDSLERVYMEFPLVDMPYQSSVVSATGNSMAFVTNQSMATTIALCEDFETASHLGIRELFKGRRISKLAVWAWDFLSMSLPFGSGWGHEEYHRAVMGLRGVSSYDEIWNFKLFSQTVSVSHETDEALAAMHDGYINDFLRMNTAGIEAQTHLVQRLQRNDFFYHRNLMNGFSYWMNILNNWMYITSCADPNTDETIKSMNEKETTIESRDFTGMDLSAWAYELYHPGVKYAERGTHSTGTGIARYITYNQIGDEGVKYLKKQGVFELINLLSPMSIGINRIKIRDSKSGPWYGNFAFRHYLTNFGNDISLDLLLETPGLKLYAAPHLYSNQVASFPGLEAGIVDKSFLNGRLRMNASARVWAQPESFTTKEGKFGGMVSADAAYSFGRFEPYVEVSGKTAGWVVGDVNLASNFSCRAGLRWLIFGSVSK